MKKVLLFAVAGAAVGLVLHLDDKTGNPAEGKPTFTDRLLATLEKLPPVIAVVAEHFASLNEEHAGNAHDEAPADDNTSSNAGDSATAPV